MTRLIQLSAREILDSRGDPTIEVDALLEDGGFGRAAAPSGASIGSGESRELRDGDIARYAGRGVRQAVAQVREVLAPALVGLIADREHIDARLIELDGTPNRSRLGSNTMLAVSIAVTRAASGKHPLFRSLAAGEPCQLPVPMFNVLNGGAHADNDVDFEEFMVAPVGAATYSEALQMGREVYRALRALLKRSGKTTAVGDEGGFAPNLDTHTEAPELLLSAIESASLKPRSEIVIAVDAAASALFDQGSYTFRKSMRRRRTTAQMIRFYENWLRHYPVWSIEDGLAAADIEGWRTLTQELGTRVQLVGDDLCATHTQSIRAAIAGGLGNAVLIKPNQVGTVSEALEAIEVAQGEHWGVIIGHRSGETDDDFIADLAVAVHAGQIKAGAPVRGERVAKYNRLLRIEEALGSRATYAGQRFCQVGGFHADKSAQRRDAVGL